MAQKILTTHEAIKEYWESRVYEGDLGIDWCDGLNRCWRCGDEHKTKSLNRCHIIPAQSGGKDEPSNFVLLCRACHDEAPTFDDDKDSMWLWIKSTRCSLYGEFWLQRVITEFEKIYKRPPNFEYVDPNVIIRELNKIALHFGPKPMTLASKAMAFAKAGA